MNLHSLQSGTLFAWAWCFSGSLPLLKALQSVAISSNDTLKERLQNFFDNQWPVFIWGGHDTHQGTLQCIHDINNMHCWPSFIDEVKLLPRRPTDQPVSKGCNIASPPAGFGPYLLFTDSFFLQHHSVERVNRVN